MSQSNERKKENDYLNNDDITWDIVYDKIPKLINLIKQLVTEKYEKFNEKISLEEYIKKYPLDIIEEEPYIMEEKDFDKVDFYKYILKCTLYFLKEEKENPIHTLSPVILKHLIDLCNILEILLSKSENYEKEDIKYYLYHLISAFSNSKKKLENDYKFLRCGIELLLKNYEVKDFHEYFSMNDKDKMRKEFYSLLSNIINDIFLYIVKNDFHSSKKENKYDILDKIHIIKKDIQKLEKEENEINFLDNINKYSYNLKEILECDDTYKYVSDLFYNLNRDFPKDINEFYYSVFCCELSKNFEDYAEKYKKSYSYDLNDNKIISLKSINSFLNYFYKFKKYRNKLQPLFQGKNSFRT